MDSVDKILKACVCTAEVAAPECTQPFASAFRVYDESIFFFLLATTAPCLTMETTERKTIKKQVYLVSNPKPNPK